LLAEFLIASKALFEVPKGVSFEDSLITDLLSKEPDFPGTYG
jgi:hypothetical protein